MAVAILLLQQQSSRAQVFVGTNQPGTGSGFTFYVPAGVTNLSLVVSNTSSVFSHLYLKREAIASTFNHDFAARLNAVNNSLNLELPELASEANYSLWVQTPTNSMEHAFSVTLSTNRPDARLVTMPITKAVEFSTTGTLTNNVTHYFRIDVPTNLPGWRVVLSAPSGYPDPDLRIQRGVVPTATGYLKRSLDRPLDTLFFDASEATNHTYFVSVSLPASPAGATTYTLSAELASIVELAWEPGTTAEPANAFTNRSTLGGDYYFKVITQTAESGVWRTRLNVQTGEADLRLRRTSLPTSTTADHVSARPGSDGVALVQTGQYTPGQVYYAMITAMPGAEWSVYSGNLFVTPLATPGTDNRGGTNSVIAPEGLNFYRTTIDSGTIAWRLDLGLLTNDLYVRHGKAAHSYSASYYNFRQSGHALVVPPYLEPGAEYFVTISGTPGETFTLDSRQQPVYELAFDSSTNVVATNQGYLTYRVAVPPEQIGWQLDLASSTGNPGFAVRHSAVASEHFNTGFSQRTNAAFETLTLVPPTLTDGSYYITIYGKPPFTAVLTNTRPLVTAVDYTFAVTNDLPGRQGWRFYRLSDFDQQLDALGWELLLGNYLPNTEITVRRSHLPGRWSVSTNFNKTTITTHVDASSTKGFLQRPRHAADVWYVGINNTNQALGPFVLEGREIPRPIVPLNPVMITNTVSGQQAGMVRYWQVDVPTNALGLEVRVMNSGSGDPRVVVARGMLPVDLRSVLVNSNTWNPNTSTNWPVGAQVHHNTDWTGFLTDAAGTSEAGRFFFAGRGNPLESGSYYIGVVNGAANTNLMNYSLLIRGFFETGSFVDLDFLGAVAGTSVHPHETRWHRVTVPTNAVSWKLKLAMDSGEGLLVLRRGGLPNYGAARTTLTGIGGCELEKLGNEHYALLSKSPETNVSAGVYYLGMVGQGVNPSGTRSGSNVSSFTLSSEGPLLLTELGAVDLLGMTHLQSPQDQEGGEIRGFRFTVPTNTPVVEVRLLDRTGNPRMVLRNDDRAASPPDTYGYFGGWPAIWSNDKVIRIPNPDPGVYTLLIQAAATSGSYSNATYTLDVSAQPMEPLAFDAGVVNVTNQFPDGWRYFKVTLPAGVLGWDLRLTNVLAGDPKIVICRDQVPFNLSTRTAVGASWSPYASTNWPTGNQLAPDKDWTGYTLSANGTNETGRIFTSGMGNPLEPGTYIVGIASGGSPGSASRLAYTLVSRGIGTNLAIPVHPLNFAGGGTNRSALPPREPIFYQLEVPTNTPSWQLRLAVTNGEAMMVLRRGGVPNFGAAVSVSITNIQGCKLQKSGDEHFALLSAQSSFEVPAGTYYLAVVSEGVSPVSTRIGSNTCDYVLYSIGTLPIAQLGQVSYVWTNVSHSGGSVAAYQFNLAYNPWGYLVRLLNRVGNPSLTLRADTSLPRSKDPYGVQGGWTEDWLTTTNIINLQPAPDGSSYSLLVHASSVSGSYPDASYTLYIDHYVDPTNYIAFDGGKKVVQGHLSGTWRYFFTDVPTNSLGWDLRLTNINSGIPKMVICRAGFPSDLTSRLANGTVWNWGAATQWPAGAQAVPAVDWTGRRYETNLVDTTGTIFAAGMGSPLEPGPYVIGISSAPGSAELLSYTLISRGIGTNYMIPVRSLGAGTTSHGVTNLSPREAAYYSLKVETNTPLWKLRLACMDGEGLLVVRKDAIPNVLAATNMLASAAGGGHKVQRIGDEHLLLGEAGTTPFVLPGDYYVAVIGEGRSPLPAANMIGGGGSTFTLTSDLPSQIKNLGFLTPGPIDVLVTNTLAGGESAAYEFTLSVTNALGLTVSLEDFSGNPLLGLRSDEKTPLDLSAYGQDGGYKGFWQGTERVSINNPTSGVYRVTLLANSTSTNWPSLDYTMRIHAEPPAQFLSFDGGSVPIQEHQDLWKMFVVHVPTNAVGWDLRLVEVSGGSPRMVICRDKAPLNLTSRNELFSRTNWPAGYQLAPSLDWTGLNDANGTSVTGRVFQVGMGNPLEPGIYYVGITNTSRTNPASYTIVSRGIGTGFSVPVNELSFSGGIAGQSLAAREAAWYRVQVPAGVPAWKVALWLGAGDGLLLAQRDYLPNIGALSTNLLSRNNGGKKMQKTGSEHLMALPFVDGKDLFLTPGVYYLGVVSEGINPSNAVSRIGTGSSSFDLWSEGSNPPIGLGSVGGTDLLGQASLSGGECELWTFNVPAGIPALEVSLEQTTGAPVMTLGQGVIPPAAPLTYGADGGATIQRQSSSAIILPNPGQTNFSLTVQASGSGFIYQDADFKVRVRPLPITMLNFSATLNTNGYSNIKTATILDGEKTYFLVQIPEMLGQIRVIGWKLSLGAIYGSPVMRVRRDSAPDDSGPGTSAYYSRQAVFVPDFLTPGTWYVEVKASGLTEFVISSEPLELHRAAWQMPVQGGTVTTPGLPEAEPLFGDTGISVGGIPLPDDGGTDVEQDSFHYYAVNVPPENSGVLHTKLEAISGNPNLYLRAFAPPTLSHNAIGAGGPLYDRALTNALGTEYGNWVVLDGKTELNLASGVHYLAVHAAGGSHVRYRLQLSTGNIDELDFHGGVLAAQTLAAGDWRYYRVNVPITMPGSWTVSFGEQQGDVTVYLRDTVPPGQGRSATDYVDWSRDARNHGPYPSLAAAGDHTLLVPPVRPGNVYYLGVRAVSDASFVIASTPGANPIHLDGLIAFKGGYVTNQLEPGAIRRYRIDVPLDARRWVHSAVHTTGVRFYLDQGTLPTMTAADHWLSGGANSSLNAVLYDSSWPWLPGQMYFLAVTNTSTATQPFSFRMDGKDCSDDDFDTDGLPDCWELKNFGTIYTYGPNSDPDGDGISNFQEHLAGTDPMDPNSFALTSPFSAPEGKLGFYVVGPTNRTYRVQSSPAVKPANWSDRTTYQQTMPVQLILIPIEPQELMQFYRVVSP